MTDYQAPTDAVLDALDAVGLGSLLELDAFAHVDRDMVATLVEEFGRFVDEVIVPTDRVGDEVGSTYDPVTSEVTTPEGFAKAYGRYVESGWGALAFPQEHGGGGLPRGRRPGPAGDDDVGQHGAVAEPGADPERDRGTDQARHAGPAGALRAPPADRRVERHDAAHRARRRIGRRRRAHPGRAGRRRHLADHRHQAVHHLGRARPDRQHRAPRAGPHAGAPAGTKGLSLFLVSKRAVDADGRLGERNAVRCVSIEHKVGIHASPTCVLDFDRGRRRAGGRGRRRHADDVRGDELGPAVDRTAGPGRGRGRHPAGHRLCPRTTPGPHARHPCGRVRADRGPPRRAAHAAHHAVDDRRRPPRRSTRPARRPTWPRTTPTRRCGRAPRTGPTC